MQANIKRKTKCNDAALKLVNKQRAYHKIHYCIVLLLINIIILLYYVTANTITNHKERY